MGFKVMTVVPYTQNISIKVVVYLFKALLYLFVNPLGRPFPRKLKEHTNKKQPDKP